MVPWVARGFFFWVYHKGFSQLTAQKEKKDGGSGLLSHTFRWNVARVFFFFFQLSGTQTPEMRKNVVEKRRNGCRAARPRMTLQGIEYGVMYVKCFVTWSKRFFVWPDSKKDRDICTFHVSFWNQQGIICSICCAFSYFIYSHFFLHTQTFGVNKKPEPFSPTAPPPLLCDLCPRINKL